MSFVARIRINEVCGDEFCIMNLLTLSVYSMYLPGIKSITMYCKYCSGSKLILLYIRESLNDTPKKINNKFYILHSCFNCIKASLFYFHKNK